MKKNIAYYLEDPERLSEISLLELNKWVEEMPYSQPLRLLVDMKSEKFDATATENNSSYGAYFAEDYEPLTKKAAKDLVKLSVKQIKKDERGVANASSGDDTSAMEELAAKDVESGEVEFETPSTISHSLDDDILEVLLEDGLLEGELNNEEDEAIESVIVKHNLVDDVSEDTLEEDLLETNPNVVLVNEVKHETADEVLEDELENEVLEIVLDDVEVVASFSELDSLLESKEALEEVEGDKYAGLVDYKSFVVGVNDEWENGEEDEIEERNTTIELLTTEETMDVQEGELVELNKSTGIEGTVIAPKKVKKKLKKKTEKTYEVDKKKKASKKKVKHKEERKEGKLNVKNSIKITAKNNKKDKSKPAKEKNSTDKKVKGDILKTDSSTSKKSVKDKAKKSKKRVKYVVVNEATTNDFKLKDYDGVSKFTNWLLEQKSINGNHEIEEKKPEVLAEKKKDKKKKKRKKNKVLKVAQDSVKKSEMILSEPLANIMAAQGHIKKARKMYKQLSLIFPEKSSYFVAKIENLKKK